MILHNTLRLRARKNERKRIFHHLFILILNEPEGIENKFRFHLNDILYVRESKRTHFSSILHVIELAIM